MAPSEQQTAQRQPALESEEATACGAEPSPGAKGGRILVHPVQTPALKGVRHHVQAGVFDQNLLWHYFDAVKAAFNPQTVDYGSASYASTRWSISCFMEYKKGVAKGKITMSEELLEASRPILQACDQVYAEWCASFKKLAPTVRHERAQSFITRYRATGLETHLPKHIDGGDVDGSLIVALPTDVPFEGGGLTIWDGPDANERTEYVYPLEPGSICLLDSSVWHQSNPVTKGERWVLVVFYRRLNDAQVDLTTGKTLDATVVAARRAWGNRFRAVLRLQQQHGQSTPPAS